MAAEDDRSAVARWRRVGGLGLIGGVLALVLLAAIWVQGRQLALVQQSLRGGDGYAVLSLYQVEIEYLRLRDQWQHSLATPGQDLDALRLRYDVWVSRVALARSPSLARLMADEPAYERNLGLLQAFVANADRQLGAGRSGPPDPVGLGVLATPLHALAAPIHELTLLAAHRVAARADVSNQALQQQSRLGLWLNLFLIALCAAFALLAMRQMRQLQQRREALEDLAARLREARQEAEAASAAKSGFLANMSHEIRTPFQGLMGMLSLLRESGLPARQAEQLRLAMESADHLLTILNDILDLSRLESGRLSLNPAPLDLRKLLRQVEAVMRPPAAAKSLALHMDAEPAVPEWIVADGTRVKQVLFNLLSNAIKFSPHGSISLDVRVDEGPPEMLRFIVTDTGIGMDREFTERLFQRFTADDAHPDRRHGGAGLGLEISRNLARLMGGDIAVHSVPGEGSRFTFGMPLQRPPSVPAAPPAAALAGATRPLRVLVAEDHPVNRQYMASLLESLHHPAHFVGNGRDAVQAVQQERFDLVLMDLHMPELDGIGATVTIRALPDRAAATVPIIALTADAFQDTRERCLLAGMNDFLTKPVSPQSLATALRRLFGQDAAEPPTLGRGTVPPPPALAASVELIDQAAVQQVLQGLTADQLGALMNEFLAQGTHTVLQMRAAVRDGQPLELRAHAHAARGAALNLGLAALAQTAQALHEGAAHLPAHEIAHLVQRFETLLPRTRQAAIDAGLLPGAGAA